MIRSKNKIYGEPNDPNTVLAPTSPSPNQWIVGDDLKNITAYLPGPNRILITNGTGQLTALSFSGQANKIIGTDDSGNIVLYDRSDLYDT